MTENQVIKCSGVSLSRHRSQLSGRDRERPPYSLLPKNGVKFHKFAIPRLKNTNNCGWNNGNSDSVKVSDCFPSFDSNDSIVMKGNVCTKY